MPDLGFMRGKILRWYHSEQNLQASTAPRKDDKQLASFLKAVKSCSAAKDLREARRIHSTAVASGLLSSGVLVANALVSMFGKCGSVPDARRVFDEAAARRDVVSWNAIILAYAENNQPHQALELFQGMKQAGFAADNRTYLAAVTACIGLWGLEETKRQHGKAAMGKVVVLEIGRDVHGQASAAGYASNVYVSTSLVTMYSKFQCLGAAREVFDRMKDEEKNVVSWTAMMMGCVENGDEQQALELFEQMQRQGCVPNSRSFVAALLACAGLAAKGSVKEVCLERARGIHSQAVRVGCGSDMFLASTLIHLYCKCGELDEARAALQQMPRPGIVSWNAIVLGHVENGESERALEMFSEMRKTERPNARSFVAALMACSSLAAKEFAKKLESLKRGMDLHRQAVELGCETELFVATALIDMYAKCGSMVEARKCFDRMPSRNTVTWNTLILGYAENGGELEALEVFREMKAEKHLVPDTRTYSAVLMACGSMAGLDKAREFHGEIRELGLEQDAFVANCLVDCYCSCGSLEEAQQVFDSMGNKTVVSYSSLIAGYSRHGRVGEAFGLFQRMQDGGFQADKMTFTSLLAACSHGGLVERGKELFELMSSRYRVEPDLDHYHCLIDLLGRANRLDEALETVSKMPFVPNAVTWKTVLGACQKWNNVQVAEIAFEKLKEVDEHSAASYVLMANISSSSPYT